MTPSALSQLGALAAEAVADGVRRRVALALAILAVLSLFAVDSCTSCAEGTFVVDGTPVDGARLFGWTGMLLYGALGLWTVAISGALASDHLQQSLEDGTAQLVLARPVGRGVFALARLAGALAVSLGTGGILLAGTALFLHARYGFALGPAGLAALATALGAVAIGALAMTASLYLPRLATLIGALLAVAAIAAANAAALTGSELSAFWSALDRYGPPLGTSIALAVAEWSGREIPVSAPLVGARLALWAGFAPALLSVCFRRKEV